MGTSANDIVKSASGVEFGLKWGYGLVESVSTPPRKRNGRVAFRQDGFEFPNAGSVEIRRQADLIATLKEAVDTEVYFAFRLESHRDDSIDKSIPFAELLKQGKEEDSTGKIIHARLVEAYPEGTPEAKALIERCEAEAAAGVVGAAAQTPLPAHSTPVANAPAVEHLPGESWEYAAATGCTDLAFELLHESGKEFTPSSLKFVAATLLKVADDAQTAYSGKLHRAGRAHTRARGAMRTAIKRYPIPAYSKDAAEWDEWSAKVTKVTLMLLQTAEAILAA